METMIKIGANGEQLQPDAPQWDAVLLPRLGLMFSATDTGAGELTFKQAEAACANLTLASFNDWQMPERQELEAILDLTRYNPAIDPVFFRDAKSDWYWTRTPVAWSSGCAWLVYFSYGYVGNHDRYGRAFVRAVRRVSPAGQ
ncbi:MAG TPA: DUF1566 domain-containing protein [Frateuria sp.]|uniref:Lcl C-terminal domain-containing protein n=1 Tax=Frateuria sp. TaxID=2211372 RepID=UPI002D7E53EC|nr:DUF1566 domain-containing protein [Frateuria sp.]HET6805647.1 DUF1566 domain-containing protein [Frateuria sp.]